LIKLIEWYIGQTTVPSIARDLLFVKGEFCHFFYAGGYNHHMDPRQRFYETMSFGSPDRPPLFDEGFRDETLNAWRMQGLPENVHPIDLFQFDRRDEIEPDLWPLPDPEPWPMQLQDLWKLERALDSNDLSRLPQDWVSQVKTWKNRDHVVMLRVCRGFFQSIGVQDWRRFYDMMFLLKDAPQVVRKTLEIQGEFNSRVAEKVLRDVKIDAALFSEPIGDNNGPLISPERYRELVLPTYQPILDVLRRHAVPTIILRAYANVNSLIPDLLSFGFNCLWVVEVRANEMDYRRLRREYGTSLGLIGGLDLDTLREDKLAIQHEVEEKALPLLAQGGYAPLLDGRVREDIPWENYVFYRKLLERLALEKAFC
jgi:hypothetical protein